MVRFPGGIEGLRALNQAVNGELYRLLGICKDAGYRPRFVASPTETDHDNRLEELNLVFEALNDDDELMLGDVFRVSMDSNPKVFELVLHLFLEQTKERINTHMALMRAGIRALDRAQSKKRH